MLTFTRRGARKLETTVVSYSRQSLPRPARLYSAPSKRANAPALATATVPADHAAYTPMDERSDEALAVHDDMKRFLRRRTPYTILPTQLPEDATSPLNEFYFTDSPTQDLVSVMDACLHNLYDVPRAKQIFERLRASSKGEAILDAKVYNSFLDAYLDMATSKDTEDRALWLNDLWKLYGEMEAERDKVRPTANTYAIIIQAWLRFEAEAARNPDADEVSGGFKRHDPAAILRRMVDRQIPATIVVSDRAFTTNEDATEAIKVLSKAAVEMGLSKIVNELGMADMLGRQGPDPLENVPEAIPVMRQKKHNDIEVVHDEEGNVIDVGVREGAQVPQYEVPFNLEALRKHLSHVVFARRVLPEDTAARQKLLEESVYDVAVQRLKRQAELFEELGLGKKGLSNADLQMWMWDWHQKLQSRLQAEIANVASEEKKLRSNPNAKLRDTRKVIGLSPFLSLLKPEKLSLITVLELMHLQGTGGVSDGMKTARALLAVGKAVELEYKAEMCKKNNITIPASNTGRPLDNGYFSGLGYRDLHARRIAARKHMEDAEDWTSDWTQLVRVKVGSFLVDALMDVATVMRSATDRRTSEVVSEEQPAFFHSYEYLRGHKLGVIKLNPVVSERLAKDALRETLHPRHLPMLMKPKPWLSHDQGGYLYNRTSAMRFKESQEQQVYLRQASSLGNLELIYAGLDVLGSTPWQVNRQVFDIVLKVWNSGERLSKIPPAVFDAPEPERPENMDHDPRARMVYLQRMKVYTQQKANNHSDRCNVNYKIEIARAFLGDIIYFPHNLDFRGRAYPIPPHLSHIGDDLSRGLLKFGEAKPLGERGLRWLKIHVANLYGFDKGNFDERVNFTHEHLADIYDSAEKPLEGKRWWVTADDPWQCLAACMELKAALDSPNPSEYECALPVHQDGTCNGLQHYAALGGDAQGARQVNLDVTDRPSDVYTFVAEMVEKLIEKDLAKDDHYAKLLTGKISRKVVKQTVMTTVYGVTFIGAREQIEKQLRDRGDIPAEECWFAASYIAKKVMACISNLFKGAKDIQNWLNMSARLISKSIPPERLPSPSDKDSSADAKSVSALRLRQEQMTSVVWTTPLGLPVVQPYRMTKRRQIITSVQTVYISDPTAPTIVNSQKQASAFPPNFIHSLDATHMMLTALECRSQGMTFASVHDSYWTHAGSIDQMSAVIRDTFIALHSSDVLGKLAEEFRERYKDYKVPMVNLRYGKKTDKFGLGLNSVVASAKDIDDLPGNVHLLTDADDTEDVFPALAELVDAQNSGTPDAAEQWTAKPKRRRRNELPSGLSEESVTVVDGVRGRFVDLPAVLPRLPKKGQFDVTTIKKSLYFFS